MQKSLKQIGNRIGWVAVIAIQRHNQVASGGRKTALVAPAVASDRLANHLRSKPVRHIRRTVGGTVVHYDYLIHELGHAAEDALDPLLFVQAGNDYRDALRFIHNRR